MQVEMRPKRNKVRPVGVLVPLRTDPVVLLVTGKRKRIVLLRPDKTLMVVGGGINQVAEHFLRRPCARAGAPRSCRRVGSQQLLRKGAGNLPQFSSRFGNGHCGDSEVT